MIKPLLYTIYLLQVFLFTESPGATTYYSATNGGYWNSPATWSTVTYGSSMNTGSFPVTGDIVYIGDGYTIYITTSCGASFITVGQGTSGILQYTGAGTFTMTVSGSIAIESGAKFLYNSNNNRTHNLFISGNFTNNGTVDLYYDSNDKVNITFNSTSNTVVSGSGTWALNDVTLTKSTSTSYYLDVQCSGFEAAISTLSVTYGTYIHNNAGTYNINGGASSFTIAENVIFKVPAGNLKFSSSADFLYLYGSLYVNGGTVTSGSTDGNKGIRYDKTGSNTPYLEISSGTMTVYGGISYASGADSDPFGFKMTGGDLLLNCGSNGTSVEDFYINDVSGSSFYMSGGTMTLQKPNSSPGNNSTDFALCGTNGTVTVTDGSIVFGNVSTPSGSVFCFTPYPGITHPHFKVTGPTGTATSLVTSKSTTANFQLLSLYIDTLKTFDFRSIQGVGGDSKKMNLNGTFDGTHALYNKGTFTARSGRVSMAGSSAQAIGGTSSTSFYDLEINNSNDINLNAAITISDSLVLTSGKLISTATKSVTLLAGAQTDIGSPASFVDGPLIYQVAGTSLYNLNFPIGTSGNYHPLVLSVQHTNSTSVSYTAQMINTPASSLGLALPLSLSKVSDVRYYTINREAVANLSQAFLKLYYYDDDGVTDPVNLRVAQDDGTTNWLNRGGIGTAAGIGTITSGIFTAFNSIYSLANTTGGSNPLPVELISFAASAEDKKALLTWETASEDQVDYFTVERSYNNSDFTPVLRVKAKGTSHGLQSYSGIDLPRNEHTVYYRLHITDMDGHSEYGPVRVIQFSNTETMNIFPVPLQGNILHIQTGLQNTDQAELKVFDVTGREMTTQKNYDSVTGDWILDLGKSVSKANTTLLISLISQAGIQYKKVIVTPP